MHINIKSFLGQEKVEINEQELKLKNFSEQLNGLRVVQISDLHINRWNKALIEETVDRVNSLKADIVVITGDVICNGKKYIPDLISMLKQINATFGKYACLGNHDHSDGDDGQAIIDAYNKADIRILVNESEKLFIKGTPVNIAGADDIELGDQNIFKMMKNINDQKNCIFLTHNPINFKEFARHRPSIVLSGHTHGCQFYSEILNSIYKSILGCEFIKGIYKYGISKLYVNRGIGTSLLTPEIFNKKFYIKTPRLNSTPEITLFKLSACK